MSSAENWRTARALAHAAGAAQPRVVEAVGLADAAGRVLAEPVMARVPLPGFDTSAMDGYAVAGDGPWRVIGRVLAGSAPEPLNAGHAAEVATGARVPENTEAVIPYEHAALDDGVLAPAALRPGRHIRREGEEITAGLEALESGRLVTPAMVALAAAVGHDELIVNRRPAVQVIVTGDEVLAGGVPTPGFVRDALGPALPAMLRASGGDPVGLDYVADAAAGLLDAVSGASADVVIVSGSSSVGVADHLEKCLLDLGAQPVVRSVDCTPGRTQSLWRLPDGRLLVGLPGNPFAAVVGYVTLVDPLCAGQAGRDLAPLATVGKCDVERHAARTRLVPVTVVGDHAVPTGYDGSAMVRGLAVADALAVIEPAATARVELVALPGARP